ncbi:hypothetical protein B0T16DRAFT_382942 [Cercophora newfieldiana]|uniref:Required for respiratory growth protein 9, mitochondrial n=1 Tax=Cercophora newfieldiana TaxID=92897 RepID=A0AA40CHS8_9PEZI|nr:hypothetical protein B0T16DRAFT_382942 [Cercophora newfieldiana]
MSCACRTAALGIFVRSVAHIQVPSTSAASRLSQATPLAGSLQRLRAFDKAPGALLGSSSRSFHATCAKGIEAEVVATAPHNGESMGDKHSQQDTSPTDTTSKRRTRAGSSKTALKPRKPKPDWLAAEPKPDLDEIRKPSLHERLLEENEDLENVQGREYWKRQKAALKEKFPDGWKPHKKLSPDAVAGIRALHQQYPEEYTTPVLADKFKMSPEAIRRILKSKWTPNLDEEIERQERWFNRGKKVWAKWAEEGVKPPVKWRQQGIVRDPSWNMSKRDKEELRAMKKEKRRVFRYERKTHIEGFDDQGLAAPFPSKDE